MRQLSPTKVYHKAMEFLIAQKSVASPDFSLEDICSDNNWGLIPIHAFCRKRNYDADFMMDRVLMSRFGSTIYFRERGEFCITYNDALQKPLVRFIIAHELGHIVLRHFDRYPEAVSPSGVLLESQYAVFEEEANQFARFILAPPPVLAAFCISDPDEIASRFSLPADQAGHLGLFLHGHHQTLPQDGSVEEALFRRLHLSPLDMLL